MPTVELRFRSPSSIRRSTPRIAGRSFFPTASIFSISPSITIHRESSNDTLYYASLDGRENRPLFHSQSNAIYGSGFLLFARGDQLMAQPFDPGTGTLSGESQSIANGVVNDLSTWHMDASASNNGLLVLGSGGTADWQLVWVDRNGKQIGTVADNLPNLQRA